MDATRPIDDRAAALLSQMTLGEKIGQMTQIEKDSIEPANAAEHELGSVLSGGDGSPSPNTPQAWSEMVNQYQQAALGLPSSRSLASRGAAWSRMRAMRADEPVPASRDRRVPEGWAGS